MKKTFITILIIQSLFAQNRLHDFIEEAVKNNPMLKAAENKYLAKEFMAVQKGVLPDPAFSITQWVDPVETRVGQQQNIFSLSQKIPFPGKLALSEEIQLSEAEQDKLEHTAATLDLILNVKVNWYELYQADQSMEILQDYQLLLNDFVEAAEAKYATGQGIQTEVLKAQVERSAIQLRIQELQRKRNSVQLKLNQLRNSESSDEIPAVNYIDTSLVQLPSEDLIQKSFNKRPEYQSAQKKTEQSLLAESLAARNWYPDLTVQANYITVSPKNSMAADAGKDAWGVMFMINLPVWFSGRKAATAEAQKNVIMQQARLDATEQNVISEIWDLQFREKSTRETIKLYNRELLPQAENSLKSALAAYRSGNLGFLELLDAERMLLQLRLTFLNEQVNYRKIIAGLERAVGGEI